MTIKILLFCNVTSILQSFFADILMDSFLRLHLVSQTHAGGTEAKENFLFCWSSLTLCWRELFFALKEGTCSIKGQRICALLFLALAKGLCLSVMENENCLWSCQMSAWFICNPLWFQVKNNDLVSNIPLVTCLLVVNSVKVGEH